jgi:uncharacterized protein YpmB
MTLELAIFIYLMLVALVSSIMLYYLKVMRPKDEQRFNP